MGTPGAKMPEKYTPGDHIPSFCWTCPGNTDNYFFLHIKWPIASDARAGEKVVSLLQNEEKPVCHVGCECSEPWKQLGIELQVVPSFHKWPGRGNATQQVPVSGCSLLLSVAAVPEPSPQAGSMTLTCCCHAQMLPNHETEKESQWNEQKKNKSRPPFFFFFFLFPQPPGVWLTFSSFSSHFFSF